MKKLFAVILSLGLILAPMPAINTAHAGGAGGYAKIVLGMANGIVGSTILMKCKMGSTQPSIIAYFAGSLVYIAAEILGGKNKRKSVNENSASMDNLKANMKEGGDYQKAAIQAQIDNEKDTLKHIEKKRKWMMATKAIYGAATALAIIEWILHFPPPPAGIGIGKPDVGGCSPDESHLGTESLIVMAYTAANGYAGGGLMGAGMAVAGPYIAKMLGLVKVGTKLRNMTVSMLNSSLGRVAFFAAATAMVMMADGELKKEADRSKKIIADLEKVKAQFDAADNSLAEGQVAAGSGSGAEGAEAELTDPSKKNYAIKELPKGQELAKHCYANTANGGVDYSEAGCKNPLKINRPTFQGKFDIPSLKAGTMAGIDMAQAIANGDIASADVAAGNLAAMAGKIDAVNKDLSKIMNDQLKAQGKKPFDVKDELKRQVDELNAELNKQKAGSGNFSLADLDSGEAATGSDLTAASDLANGEIKNAEVAAAAPVDGAAGIDLSKVGEGDIGAGDAIDPNSLSADGSANGNVASLDESLNQFESNESDISTDSDVSIFKQVSNRYFLNYTKIFQRKEIAPPLAPAEASK